MGVTNSSGMANVFDDIEFYLFNHHHYIDIPADQQRYESTWVNFPNRLFDPERGHELYQRYTRELLLAEQLGFDAIALNEHHTTYSMTPAVGVRAAYLAALSCWCPVRRSTCPGPPGWRRSTRCSTSSPGDGWSTASRSAREWSTGRTRRS
jgi:hypothetical protein